MPRASMKSQKRTKLRPERALSLVRVVVRRVREPFDGDILPTEVAISFSHDPMNPSPVVLGAGNTFQATGTTVPAGASAAGYLYNIQNGYRYPRDGTMISCTVFAAFWALTFTISDNDLANLQGICKFKVVLTDSGIEPASDIVRINLIPPAPMDGVDGEA